MVSLLDKLATELLPTTADTSDSLTFRVFKEQIYHRYQHADHLERIDERLMEALRFVETEGREGHAFHIFELPPRHGKTVTISRLFPPYVLGRYPDWRFILSSYGATLAEKNSRFARNIIRSDVYQRLFGGQVRLAPDSKSAQAWDIDGHDGGMDAMGVGGGVTGKGAQIIIIDDPVKNREEAESETYRERVWDWYTDDLYTRREPNGAVIVVMCMTGDTPVLMADGTETPLSDIKAGDEVATYDDGNLRTSKVLNHRSNGRDAVYKITMTSGKIVRANERHPFLVELHGELNWIRLKNLNTGYKIVTVRDNGASGKVRLASLKDAICPSHVEVTALRIMARSEQQMVIAHLPKTRTVTVIGESKTVTVSPLPNMMQCLRHRAASAQSANSHLETMCAPIGAESYVSTTTTRQTKYAHSCATTVISPLGTLRTKQPHSQLENTSDFTSDVIASIEPDGFAEVFDVQIERTENFIANGLVSHNTRWHEDDLVGRLLKHEPGKWKVLNLPAIAEADDPLGREEGAALWSARFPVDVLRDIETTLGSYSFSALYQQHPVPAEGGIFKRAWFDNEAHPLVEHMPVIQYAVRYWDLAMSEKTTADFTAGVKIGIGVDGHRYVLDVFHERVEWGDLTERMAQVMLADGALVAQGIEQKGFMSRAIQALNVDPRLHGYQVWGYPADTDKLTRALPAAAKSASGVVHVLNAHWTDAFLDELCGFPYGAHDDQVDAFAGAEAMLGEQLSEAVGGMNLVETAISPSPY